MRNPDRETIFRFKRFEVTNRMSAMKVGTDGVLLGAWCLSDITDCANEANHTTILPERILDAGCGTGLIALMLAQRFPEAEITAIEIDPTAAQEANDNFKASPWSDRLTLIEGDFNTVFSGTSKGIFDLIVSNPPFFKNGELSPEKSRLMARHESSLTLETLIKVSKQLLSTNGELCLILPADREEELKLHSVTNNFNIVRLTRLSTVPTKPPRRILAELKSCISSGSQVVIDRLSIHDTSGGFTKEYASLIKDFYLNF